MRARLVYATGRVERLEDVTGVTESDEGFYVATLESVEPYHYRKDEVTFVQAVWTGE